MLNYTKYKYECSAMLIFCCMFFSINTFAQDFVVEKVSGEVMVLKGTAEEWEAVKSGQKLSGNDVLLTEEKSFVQLNQDGSRFMLQGNSALGLDHIKQVSINDLLLALAIEEIRNVPKNGGNGNTQNTAVYGTEEKSEEMIEISSSDFGLKKLNGAKQLASNGFKESAVIVAKETYRNYPETKSNVSDRIFFAMILSDLELYEEAYTELTEVSEFNLNDADKKLVNSKLEKLKLEFAK